jgi:hypothetical protein
MKILCYADDTLVTAQGKDFDEVARLATVATSLVVDRIGMLGLEVALNKTEVLLFHGPRRGPPRDAHIVIKGVPIKLGTHMKYLGLVLHGRWRFEQHFMQLVPKLIGTAPALRRLLPNVGGPSASCRRLYASTIRSMATYGVPIWIDALNSRNKVLLRRSQHVIALRAIRGYRTISWVAATVLAGDAPWEL